MLLNSKKTKIPLKSKADTKNSKHKPPETTKIGNPPKPSHKSSKGKGLQVIKKAKTKTKLAPQVGDIEITRKKEIPKHELVKGEKINEVDVKGMLVKGDAIGKVGEVVQGNATTIRPKADPRYIYLKKKKKKKI
jgi:hypothetical protein